jgi:adenosylcobalamin-dependent ribonucleoside-triphosphate reductase
MPVQPATAGSPSADATEVVKGIPLSESSVRLRKRDGTLADWNGLKIVQAVQKAYVSVHANSKADDWKEHAHTVYNRVLDVLSAVESADRTVDIEVLQDIVEQQLFIHDASVGRAYILYREKRADERNRFGNQVKGIEKVPVDWSGIGWFTFTRTYARHIGNDPSQPLETFHDTVRRVMVACERQLHCGFTRDEAYTLAVHMLKHRVSVAGRFLWQLNTNTVDRLGLPSLQNCAFVAVDSPVRPFTWTFDMLMLGCGVGASIERKHVDKIPPVSANDVHVTRVDSKDVDFIVPDNREGWIHLLKKTMRAFFVTGKSFTYSTVCIRSKGTPIKSFGGVASGPEELVKGISEICEIIRARKGQKLRPIDCGDIICTIGMIVVSGNVRRSAIILQGDHDDKEYLAAKNWSSGTVRNCRAMANNSVVCSNIDDLDPEFWKGYDGSGEPYGLINLDLARKVGRLGETQYPDPDVMGFNPCAEQGLANYETCCLAEIALPHFESLEQLKEATTLLYRVCKHSLRLKCHAKETEDIVHRNMRIGLGVTGYLQATEEQRGWLKDLYVELRAFDKEYSAKHGFPASVKLSTIKPSGTLSLVMDVTPGVHPGYARYFIRRVRVASTSSLVEKVRKLGYHVEFSRRFDGTEDVNTSIVSFPCRFPDDTVIAEQVTAVQQLEYVKRLQTEWSDNSVSCTVYYRLHELNEIKEWLRKNYTNGVKTVSFLLHSEHGFDQAPYEPISKEAYEELVKRVRPISDLIVNDAQTPDDSSECAGGACPMR